MWRSSPTFRRQCRRLAAADRLPIRVILDDQPRRSGSVDAHTVFTSRRGGLVSADVYLKPSADYLKPRSDAPRLIAHEMEHIIEQLDDVDLQAQAGNGTVWKDREGAFETQRAIEAGRQVEREVSMNGDAAGAQPAPAGNGRHPLLTVAQQDRYTTPLSLRTGRVSAGGRHIVFVTAAQLVEADRNTIWDVYVLDLETHEYTLESLGVSGVAANGSSLSADISSDGRFVVFESMATNLTNAVPPPDTAQVFLRDRANGATRLLTTTSEGQAANGPSWTPVISADGTTVVFESAATDFLDASDVTRGSAGIYLIRLTSGLRARLDPPRPRESRSQSRSPTVSADGQLVAFTSGADLTCGARSGCAAEPSDNNGVADVYVHYTQTGLTRRISRSSAGADSDGPSYDPAISGDGRHVAFVSEASNLIRTSVRGTAQVYVHDLTTGLTELVSRTPNGQPGNGRSLRPAISRDGSRIAFQSLACDLLCRGKCQTGERDINLMWDVFVHDRSTRRTSRASTDDGEEWMENSRAPSLDGSGRVLLFGSRHPVDAGDTDHDEDLFIRLVTEVKPRLFTVRTPASLEGPPQAEHALPGNQGANPHVARGQHRPLHAGQPHCGNPVGIARGGCWPLPGPAPIR